MNINILIEENFKRFINQDNIDILLRRLTNEFGFTPSVFNKLPGSLKDNYFLLFSITPIELPKNVANQIVFMTADMSSFDEIIGQYRLAIIVEWIRYMKDFPLYCGKMSIAEKMGLKIIRTYKEGYCLIRNNSKTDLLKAIVNYLEVYNCEYNIP